LQFGAHMQKNSKIVLVNFEGGGGKEIFLTPYISPNFGSRELKIFQLLDMYRRYLRSEFRDLNPKNRVWGDDRRN